MIQQVHKTYQAPYTSVLEIRMEGCLLTGSVSADQAASFEDLHDGGDFNW